MRNLILSKVDQALSSAAAFAFSFSVGITGVAIPLIAITAGYRVADVGVLIAVSGAAQLAGRWQISRVMRLLPDKALVIASGLLMLGSCALLAVSLDLWTFVIAQLLQGVARAYFWTGSQSHVVRIGDRSMPALAQLNLAGGLGSLLGPIVAGQLTVASGRDALLTAAAAGGLAALLAGFLIRYRPFEKVESTSAHVGVWRRPEVREGNIMCLVAGSWRGVLNSYIPVVLAFAGITPFIIGLLVAVANVAILAGSTAIGLISSLPPGRTLLVGGLLSGLGLAAAGLLAEQPIPVAVALAVSGLAAGVIQTVGTASVSDSVHPEERGEAITSTGTFRAAALILTPLVTAALALVTPIGPAVAVTGVVIALPSLLGRLRARS